MRIVPLVLVTLCCLLAATVSSAATATPAEALVRDTTTRVLDRLRVEGDVVASDPGLAYRLAEEFVLPHFDFALMSRRTLGPHWRTATAAQRERFVAEYKVLLVRTYATAVAQYRNSKIAYMPARSLGDGRVRVRTEVDRGAGAPLVQLNYDLYERNGAWKVYDVVIDGISIVLSYRSGFSSDVAKLGMDGLIDQLARHNAEHGGG